MSLITSLLETTRPLIPDSAVAWGVREYFNRKFQFLGTMTTLQIDAAKKTALIELDLKGESQPVRITINRYELKADGDQTCLDIKEIQISREWLNSLAAEFLKQGKLNFTVPDAFKIVL